MKLLKCTLGMLLLLVSISTYAQEKEAFYAVYFFKNSNGDSEKDVIFHIDSEGNLRALNDDHLGQKVNMASFTKSVNTFIQKEKLERVDVNEDVEGLENDPNEAYIANAGEQAIYISVVLMKDHHEETSFGEDAYYSWEYIGPDNPKTEYALYKYLTPADLKVIRAKLD